jgi:hypothetical protein
MTDTQIVDAPVQTVAGYIPKPRYRTVECDWFDPEDGAAKLVAEIRSDLPFGYLSDIPLGGESSYQELWTVIAPHVRSWNALGLDVTTGTYQPVPPPGEIGIEAFRAVDPLIGIWVGTMLKQTYAQAVNNPKASSGSEKPAGGPSAANAPVSASSNRAKKSRPNRSA